MVWYLPNSKKQKIVKEKMMMINAQFAWMCWKKGNNLLRMFANMSSTRTASKNGFKKNHGALIADSISNQLHRSRSDYSIYIYIKNTSF